MDEEPTQSFGHLLRQHRLARGLTQEALAECAGVSVRGIQALERGESRPHKDTAHMLAAGLGLNEQDRASFLAAATPGPRRRSAERDEARDHAQQQTTVTTRAALPTGMLTFLIADVRGFTAYTHQHGDEAAARLATGFAVLAEAAANEHHGQVVEVRGDEVMIVFTSARNALRAAVTLLAACDAERTPALPLRCGIGLDAGEPAPVPGGYRGEALNVAARLCAQAGPGEALASDVVVGLARRVEGLTYADRGEHALKGLARPVRVWIVRSTAGEPDVTGAAPAGDGHAHDTGVATMSLHNLPAALSPLVGREQEQARVSELLADARLVTLTGSGGVGKTRLALAVAEQLVGTYAAGAWLVEFAPLTDPALVPDALARALRLREDPERSPLQLLVDSLRSKQMLLVLDNCEHLVAACAALVTTLLQACPTLRILASSQEPLGVVGERRYRVPSLSVPDPRRVQSHELLNRYEAVRLFMARAQERRDDFALTPGNARAIAEICARLDGIPLAIELAAARVVSLPVEAIAARLDARFALLTTGARTALPRQQTLRAALDWSYDLLSRPEQTLLQRLATFAGGASLEAAEVVCADPAPLVQHRTARHCTQGVPGTRYPLADGHEIRPAMASSDGGAAGGASMVEDQSVLDLLDALVHRSLAQAEQGRYALLETIRAYAHERLMAQDQEASVRWLHAQYYLRFAEHAAATLTGPEQGQALARLAVEHDNLRAALRWARERGDGPLALRLAAVLWRFWYLRGYLSEGRAWLEAALALSEDDEQGAGAARATAYHGAGVLAWAQGDYAHAVAQAEQALTLWRTLADRAGAARSLNLLGLVAIDEEHWDRAAPALEESLALRRDLQDRWGIATSLHNLGTVARGRGDHARATERYAESLALREALADQAGIAISYRDQAALALAQGDETRAQTLYRQSLPHAAALGDLVGVAQGLEGLAAVVAKQAHPEPAAWLLSAAAALREQVGAPVALRDRVAHAQLLSNMRATLGAAFEPAEAAGRGEAWEDLVAAIFDETDP